MSKALVWIWEVRMESVKCEAFHGCAYKPWADAMPCQYQKVLVTTQCLLIRKVMKTVKFIALYNRQTLFGIIKQELKK